LHFQWIEKEMGGTSMDEEGFMRSSILVIWVCALAAAGCGIGDDKSLGDPGGGAGGGTDSGVVDVCSGDWSWAKQPQDASSLLGVFGRTADDVYAFGPETFIHFDGQGISGVSCGDCAEVAAMGGPFDGALWALAHDGALLRGDGTSFETALASDATEGMGALLDLWAGEDGVWIAGTSMLSSEGPFSVSLRRWDGASLETIIDCESAAFDSSRVYLWGAGDTVFLVGSSGLALRIEGSSVEQLDVGTEEDLVDVSGVDENDVWAAGSEGTVFHFDGASWSAVEVAGLGDRYVHAVHAAPTGEVFLAASARWWLDEPAVLDQEIWASAALFALDGGEFVELSQGFSGDPLAMWWGDDTLFVAGTRQGPQLEIQGRAEALYHADYIGGIDALAMNADGDLCAVNYRDIKLRVDGAWRWLPISDDDEPTDVAAGLDGVFWVTADNHESDRPALWSVGSGEIAEAPAFDREDAHLRSAAVDRETGALWVSGSSGDLVNEDFGDLPGLVLVLRDDGWHDVSPPGATGYVWDVSPAGGRAFATSSSEGLLVFEDGAWSTIADVSAGFVEARGPEDVFFTQDASLAHWDGAEISAVAGAENVRVFDMALDPGGVLWVAGDMGLDSGTIALLRLGGEGWQTMLTETDSLFMGAVASIGATTTAASTSSLYDGVCAR